MGRITQTKVNQAWRKNLNDLGECESISGSPILSVEKLEGVADAVRDFNATEDFQARRGRELFREHVRTAAMGVRCGGAVEASDALIAEAIIQDGRLARRAQWVRSDDGIFADAALVAMGDDSPCYDMTRGKLAEFGAAGEPVKVVISTDSTPKLDAGRVVAFIAAVRIVQQFRPVEVWWQGSWLNARGGGYVLLAPLVQGDMDFSRIAYFLTDPTRDNLSFGVAHARVKLRDRKLMEGLGEQAKRSYLDGAHFVNHHGIKPAAEAIAAVAAEWLGLPAKWEVEWDEDKKAEGALQKLPPPRRDPAEYRDPRSPEQIEADERRWRAAREADEARERIEQARRIRDRMREAAG